MLDSNNTMFLLLVTLASLCSVSARLPYIIGGSDVKDPGSYPWQLALQAHGALMCGAVLISPNWVLTAAHCVNYETPSSLAVVAGMHDRNLGIGDPVIYPVSKYIMHPQYDSRGESYPNDIALVLLQENVDLSAENVQPISLPDSGEDFVGNQECWITGWGLTVSSSFPHGSAFILQEANVDIYTIEYCKEMWDDTIMESHICLGKVDKSGSCSGDSGGPLSCKVGDDWKLAGVTSWGSYTCTPELPSVYTRVSTYVDWIRATTGMKKWLLTQ